MKRLLALLVVLAAAAGAAWWLMGRERPEEVFFRDTFPFWFIDRVDGRNDLATIVAAAEPWPALLPALRRLDDAFVPPLDPERVKARATDLNPAIEAAGLPYWIDVFLYGERPLVLTYNVEGRRSWSGPRGKVEALRVRRLDRTNVVTSFLGHAGGQRPLVLLDRLEAALLDDLRLRAQGDAEGNQTDQVALGHIKRLIDERAGAGAVDDAVQRVKARDELLDAMEKRLHNGRVRVSRPDRIRLGERYFEGLQPYTELSGGRLPLILSVDLTSLKQADRAIDDGPGAKAIAAALALEADAVEAHETHHALGSDPTPGVVPSALLDYVGDDDMDFSMQADQEMRAYLGELHDSAAPPCLAVARIGRSAGGAHARRTPHHFAAVTLLKQLTGKAPQTRSEFAPLIDELCALLPADLDQRVEAAWQAFYGTAFVPVTPVPASSAPSAG